MHREQKPMNNIKDEQIAYYRARAQEYDQSLVGPGNPASNQPVADQFEGELALAANLLKQQGPFGEVLELACGTGIWTQILAARSNHLTALDAAPEMLAITRAKLGDDRIEYRQADLFQWDPTEQYDLVFFAFWLSHVLPEALDTFLAKAAQAAQPGGRMIIIDEYAPTAADRQVAKDDLYAERPLLDGRTFTIVKVFYSLDTLSEKLGNLGFKVEAQELGPSFFFLSAQLQQ